MERLRSSSQRSLSLFCSYSGLRARVATADFKPCLRAIRSKNVAASSPASVGLRDAFCKFRALPRAQAREE
jgi:hypothetical protein